MFPDQITAAHVSTIILIPAVAGLWIQLWRVIKMLEQARREHMDDLRAISDRHSRIMAHGVTRSAARCECNGSELSHDNS